MRLLGSLKSHYINMMFTPARRRLNFGTPVRSAKRARLMPRVATRSFRANNRWSMRGPSTKGTLRSQVKSLQRVVKKLQPERKVTDLSLAQTNIPVTGTVQHITAIAQGDNTNERSGNLITVVNVTCKAILTSTTAGALYRFAVVVDKEQVADTQPTAAAIFTDAIFNAHPLTALPAVANTERFRVLAMSGLLETALSANQTLSWEYNSSMTHKVAFNGTASTDMEKNNIYFVLLTNSASNTDDFIGVARITFTDL